ncbi:SMI1/KNR4 family protein [Pseudomonas indica]|uniref:SMI1/KNR4 family protein n=1 Tax=Pseudomonas indica TaxID=137658 RepID=UPI0023F64031|nr:SMI1/KNR4 family protein [Pseudomonas indica]MBU3059663.1 SMI1/KNR4 family protein [Pseudomonas indica]
MEKEETVSIWPTKLMRYQNIFTLLGAKPLSNRASPAREEKSFEIHIELDEILAQFDGAIVFENGAKFKSPLALPKSDKQGFVDLVIIYGTAEDSNNIFLVNKMYQDQIGKDFYVFGESSGGDQFCINRQSGEVFYWHHEAKTYDLSMFRIASSIVEFIEHLVPDNSDSGKSSGIISAHFDF